MALLSAAAAAAAAAVSGMYLDAKYSIGEDLAQIRGGKRMQKYVEQLYKEHGEDDWSFYHVLHCTYDVNHHSNAEALVFEGRSWTYRRLREEVGRVAETLQRRLGVRNRMVVGLFINNSPEFMFVWWALYKLGAIPAPINTSITGEHIKHCLNVSEAEMLITSYELAGIVAQTFDLSNDGSANNSAGDLGAGSIDPACPRVRQILLYDHNTYPVPSAVDQQWPVSRPGISLLKHDELPPVVPEMGDFPKSSRPKVRYDEASQYLFTSGTTGLPKALMWPAGYSLSATCPGRYPGMYEKTRRFYVCLPMFHGTAS